MVIFHSYVSLPEGTTRDPKWWTEKNRPDLVRIIPQPMPVVKVVGGQEPPETMMDGRGFLNRFGTITEGAEY